MQMQMQMQAMQTPGPQSGHPAAHRPPPQQPLRDPAMMGRSNTVSERPPNGMEKLDRKESLKNLSFRKSVKYLYTIWEHNYLTS